MKWRVLFLTVLVAMTGWGFWYQKHSASIPGDTMVISSITDAPLVTDEGKPVSKEDVHDSYTLIYFGFTHCPDICPIDVAKFTDILNTLEAEGEKIVPLFITLDPKQDTPEILHGYLQRFSPRWKGLTGSTEAIEEVTRAFHIAYDKQGETISHAGYAFLMDKKGKNIGIFSHGQPAEEIEKLVRDQISTTTGL